MAGSVRTYKLSPLAEADLEDIWLYTFRHWSADQADAYHRGIVTVCEELAAGVRQGRTVDIREGYRKHQAGSHFVFYRESEAGIEVIRILHQRWDVGRHL